MGRHIASTSQARLQALQNKKKQRRKAIIIASLAGALSAQSLIPHIIKQPMYNSNVTGQMHIQELLSGHPVRFYDELGITKLVFQKLKRELVIYSGFKDSRFISMDEQLAIFLRFCRSGVGSRQVREEFQHGPDTVSK